MKLLFTSMETLTLACTLFFVLVLFDFSPKKNTNALTGENATIDSYARLHAGIQECEWAASHRGTKEHTE